MVIKENVNELIKDRSILVTGGTGTIGRELVSDLLRRSPKVIRVLSRDENKQFILAQRFGPDPRLRWLLGDVRDRERLIRAFEGIDVIFHLAAMKHVPACEYNPFEAIRTNIIGTQNVIDAALSCGVQQVVFTSSDKAVNPCNAMGASKLMAEKLMIAAQGSQGPRRTRFSTVRFGNVLASSGSVMPTFISRIQAGEPVQVTDPRMTRFFLTFDQALELIYDALTLARGGEIFVLKMPVIRIIDLAEIMASELAGLYGGEPSCVEVIGLRAGEKMQEELITIEESTRAIEMGGLIIVPPHEADGGEPYPDARNVRPGGFGSEDMEPLDRETIREMLFENRILTQSLGSDSASFTPQRFAADQPVLS